MSNRLQIMPLVLVPLALAVAGCSALQWRPDPDPSADPDAMGRSAEAAAVPVQRTGRYTAVALTVTEAERDPLAQLVTLRFPTSVRTVRSAIEHALRGTGYRFSDFDAASAPDLPLPDVHRELGPMRLTDALAALAGEPWQLRVNPVTRVASLDLRPEFRRYLPAPVAAATPAPTAVAAAAPAPAAVAPAPTAVPAIAAAAPVAGEVPAATAAPATKPWRPGETLAGEVLEDGLPRDLRIRNPWLVRAGLAFASANGVDIVADTAPGRDGGDIVVGEEVSDAGPHVVAVKTRDRARVDRDQRHADDAPVVRTALLQPLVRLGPGTLSVLLDTWMRAAGWALVWKSGADFRVDVPFAIDAGSPADPVRLMAGLSDLYGIPHCAYPANRTVVVLQPGTDLRQECR